MHPLHPARLFSSLFPMNLFIPTRFLSLCAALMMVLLIGSHARAQDKPGNASITGRVLNAATQVYLNGAVVSVLGGPSTTTDGEGRFQFTSLAAGVYTLTATYTGLDPFEVRVQVGANESVTREIGMV